MDKKGWYSVSTEADARAVYNQVRTFFRFSLKSDNKRYSNVYGLAPQGKKDNRSLNILLCSERAWVVNPSTGVATVAALLAMKPKERLGNCVEYATVAAYLARRSGMSGIWITQAPNGVPVTHVMCVFGLPRHARGLPSWAAMQSDQDGTQDAWVCDAWAGILCPYKQFPTELRRQMSKWYSQGKEVRIDDGSDEELYISAPEFGRRLLENAMIFHPEFDATYK